MCRSSNRHDTPVVSTFTIGQAKNQPIPLTLQPPLLRGDRGQTIVDVL